MQQLLLFVEQPQRLLTQFVHVVVLPHPYSRLQSA
jgi:hypothetical protein